MNRNNTPRQRQFGPAGGGRFATAVSSEPRSSFNDFNARIDLRPTSRDQVAFSLYQGNDDVDNSRELQVPAMFLERLASRGIAFEGGFKITDVRDYANLGASAQWNHDWNTHIKTQRASRTPHTTPSRIAVLRLAGDRDRPANSTQSRLDGGALTHPIRFTPSHELTLGVQHTATRSVWAAECPGAQRDRLPGPKAAHRGSTARLDRDTAGELNPSTRRTAPS